MNERYFYTVVAAVTVIFGALISWGILSTQWRTEAIKLSLEKGINPLYVKCSLDSHTNDECKSMIMAMSLSGQFKDTTAPVAVSPASQSKK
jgi:hypothetical protein